MSVANVVRSVLPDGTNGTSRWNTVCEWPPDLFAAMAAITERSGLYSEPIFTSYWVAGFVPTEQWIGETLEIARERAATGKPPKAVKDCWRQLTGLIRTARVDDHGE